MCGWIVGLMGVRLMNNDGVGGCSEGGWDEI
jgi:hypothetical protein